MKNLFILVLFATILSGCSSNVKLSGRYLSNVDPSVDIAKTSSILVVSNSKGNRLTNRRYMLDIISAFKARGFTNISETAKDPDYKLIVNFSSEEQIKQQSIPVFTNERSMPYTTCHQRKDNGQQVCSTHYYFRTPMLRGYRSVNIPTNVYTFQFTLKDKQNNAILDSISTVVHQDCSQWKVYKFLASDAIARTSFSTPVDKQYSVKMPKDYRCE